MGNNQNKEPQQISIPTGELQMKSKFVAGQLEHQVDKLVNKVMRDERNLLNKYSEGRRSIEDMLFKDEVSQIKSEFRLINYCVAPNRHCRNTQD